MRPYLSLALIINQPWSTLINDNLSSTFISRQKEPLYTCSEKGSCWKHAEHIIPLHTRSRSRLGGGAFISLPNPHFDCSTSYLLRGEEPS